MSNETTNEPRICQRGVDGSAGCGHKKSNVRDKVCRNREPGDPYNVICGHRCDFSPAIEDGTHEFAPAGWIYEDELGEVTEEFYAAWFPLSRVIDGVRMGPPHRELEATDAPVHKVAKSESLLREPIKVRALAVTELALTDKDKKVLGAVLKASEVQPSAPEPPARGCPTCGADLVGCPECGTRYVDGSGYCATCDAFTGPSDLRLCRAAHLEPIRKAVEKCEANAVNTVLGNLSICKSDWNALVALVKGEK